MTRSLSLRTYRIAVAALFAVACSGTSKTQRVDDLPSEAPREESRSAEKTEDEEKKEGLEFDLRSAKKDEKQKAETARHVSGQPLGEEATDELLQRLPDIRQDPADRKAFSFRSRSKPPPKAGEVVETSFPTEAERGTPDREGASTGPLEVVRRAPRGSVDIAPRLSVTFSQPMVPLGGDQASEVAVPVRLEPKVEGTWRWIGTRTLLFEPATDGFPMATNYRATIPAQTSSMEGVELEKRVAWTFATPPPRVETFQPTGGPMGLEPLFYLGFNQEVDPERILEYVRVWGGGATYTPKLASDERVEQNDEVARLLENSPKGHSLAFLLTERLKPGTTYQLGLAEGAPSAEGDRRAKEGQYVTFHTFDPLEVEESECGARECWPGAPWIFEFNNPLESASLDASAIRVEPELEDKKVDIHHDTLIVRGRSRPETSYEVEIPGAIRDEFGQRLEKPHRKTFEVSAAPPRLFRPHGTRTTLDPKGPRSYRVRSSGYRSLHVVARRVEPSDWPAYADALRRRSPQWPGSKVFERTLEVDSADGAFSTTPVDLSKALDDGTGHVVLIVEGGERRSPPRGGARRRRQSFQIWVQSTQLAIDAYIDDRELVAWTTSLADGTPLKDAEVSLGSSSESVQTDEQGVARLQLPDEVEEPWSRAGNIATVHHEGETAFVSESTAWSAGGSRWTQRDEKPGGRWFVWDDRNLYRPGETAHLKGWLRRTGSEGLSMPDEGTTIEYVVHGPRRNEIDAGTVAPDEYGGFALDVDFPDDINLGRVSVEFRTEIGDRTVQTRHYIRVQEFRTPTFEVDVQTPSGPHVVGDSFRARLQATYYAGGEVRGADADWWFEASSTEYAPPGWDEFVFGRWRPWWLSPHAGKSRSKSISGKTDGSGEHAVTVDLQSIEPPRPQSLQLHATVADVNRQAYSGSDQVLVHPSATYVGLKTDRWFVGADDPIVVDTVATDIDGNSVEDRKIRVLAERIDWTYRDGEWREVTEEQLECLSTSADKPVECRFEPEKGGTWRLTARVRDDKGRVNETQMRIWVAGGSRPTSRRLEREEVRLVPEKERWRPGETAEILVQSPFADAEGIATYRSGGEWTRRRFTMEGSSHKLSVPVEESNIPELELRVDLVGSAPRLGEDGEPVQNKPDRPAFATGTLELPVSTRSKTLDVTIEPASSKLRPGADTSLQLAVQKAGGEPAEESQIAVAVVDEAILAAADYHMPDPVEAFFPETSPHLDVRQFRREVRLATLDALPEQGGPNIQGEMRRPQPMAPTERAAGLAAADVASDKQATSGGGSRGIELRSDFRPVAFVEPSVETDADGRAQVSFTLPDNVTRYRALAVAVHGSEKIGSGEATFATRLPLRVSPAMPRFLNSGDRAELPVVVHNQSGKERTVRLAGRARNLELAKPHGVKFDVPAGDRVELRFPSETERAGTARLQFAATSGDWSDAAEVQIPVWTPATTEAYATYGTIEKGAVAQTISVPEEARSAYGGLDVTTSSTALHELTDAFLYLVDYPYECSEQVASRLLAVAALRDVLAAFDAEGLPPEDELVASLERDVETLVGLQTRTGGFAFWSPRDEASPYVSVHVAHALSTAERRGTEVPEHVLDRARRYLRNIERHLPGHWPAKVRRTVHAYALYVLQKMGSPQPAEVESLAKHAVGDELSVEAAGWLLSTFAAMSDGGAVAKELRRQIDNRIVEEAGSAHLAAHYDKGRHLLMYSNRRADALVLEALLRAEGQTGLAPKLVEGLLGHRTKGRWSNTQENVFVLLALRKYFETFEKEEPDFAADIWLGDGYVGRHEFRERTAEKKRVQIPMDAVLERTEDRNAKFLMDKSGTAGRLYYRLGLSYAPESRELQPVERGFAVERSYEAVDEGSDLRRTDDGTWKVKAGARIRVRVRMVAPSRRHHVALVDPFAAGFEPMNPAVATTGPIPDDPKSKESTGRYWWWNRPWFEHQNLRDERAEAFASTVYAGVHTYSYVVRATTPGEFVVPPPKAEEMYHPETFGRGSTDRVVVVGK